MKRFIISFVLLGLIICSICSCGKKEEPVAEEETTEVEEKIEEVKPVEPVMVDEAEPIEEETVDYTWAKEYLDIIDDWHMNHTGDQAEGYSFIYLNDDDIPELCLFCTDDVSVAIDIYTFSDSKANHVDRVDYQHDMRETPYTIMGGQGHGTLYIAKKGILFNGYAGGGTSEDEGYILNGVFLEPIISIHNSQSVNDDTGEEVDDYIVYYKKKGESLEEDHGAGELFLDDDNKYINTIEADYDFDYDDGKGIGDDKLYSYDEITKELKALLPEEDTEEEENAETSEPWKEPYRDYLNRIIAGEESVGGYGDGGTYDSWGGNVIFALQDITDDGKPELMVSCEFGDLRPDWTVYTVNDKSETECLIDDFDFYDPDNDIVYSSDRVTFEGYDKYKINNGKLEHIYSIGEGDEPGYVCGDGKGNFREASEAEMETFRNEFNSGLQKYGLKGIKLTKENINKELGNGDSAEHKSETDSTAYALSKKYIGEYYWQDSAHSENFASLSVNTDGADGAYIDLTIYRLMATDPMHAQLKSNNIIQFEGFGEDTIKLEEGKAIVTIHYNDEIIEQRVLDKISDIPEIDTNGNYLE